MCLAVSLLWCNPLHKLIDKWLFKLLFKFQIRPRRSLNTTNFPCPSNACSNFLPNIFLLSKQPNLNSFSYYSQYTTAETDKLFINKMQFLQSNSKIYILTNSSTQYHLLFSLLHQCVLDDTTSQQLTTTVTSLSSAAPSSQTNIRTCLVNVLNSWQCDMF